jgi:hypothetical protein
MKCLLDLFYEIYADCPPCEHFKPIHKDVAYYWIDLKCGVTWVWEAGGWQPRKTLTKTECEMQEITGYGSNN